MTPDREDFPLDEGRDFARACLKAWPGAKIAVREQPVSQRERKPGQPNKRGQSL